MTCRLAVVIPFYKLTFFAELLEALAAQTNPNFHVYVGNDASAPEASEICNSYRDRLDIAYHRFGTRMGHFDLAAQWNRCVALSMDEEWVWVVPDDDLPSSDCVAAIHSAADVANEVCADLLHLDFGMIDRSGNRLSNPTKWERIMRSDDMYLRMLNGRGSGFALPNLVFRRTELSRVGGFISFPKGWLSDHATALATANGGLVVAAEGACVDFRMSGENISSKISDGVEKMQARLQFARWLVERLPSWYGDDFSRTALRWFYWKGEFYVFHVWPSSKETTRLLFELAKTCQVELRSATKLKIIGRTKVRKLVSYVKRSPPCFASTC